MNSKVWDPFRERWIAPRPEELVRLHLLQTMTEQLGYPKSLIAVEREEGGRRFDFLCFVPGQEGLLPLLLGECKATPLTAAAERQAWGYNQTCKAPFLCLASPKEVRTLWREQGKVRTIPFLPPFQELVEKRCQA